LLELLEGFEFVPSDHEPRLTLDKQMRVYLNTSTQKLLGLKAYDRVALAYSPSNKEIAVVKSVSTLAGLSKQNMAEYMTSNFVVDKRKYLHTRRFAKIYGFTPSNAPYYFSYQRGSSDGNIFIFKLENLF